MHTFMKPLLTAALPRLACILSLFALYSQESNAQVGHNTDSLAHVNEVAALPQHNYIPSVAAASTIIADSAFEGKRAEVNISRLLEGNTAGLQFTNGGGRPGADVAMRIRGITSMYDVNDPTILLNGFIYTGSLWMINPHDIDSIVVLKDAPATASYAGRSANGIINIITKKAAKGSTNFRLSVGTGISTRAIAPAPTLDAAQYYETYWAYLAHLYGGPNPSNDARQRASENLDLYLGGYNAFNIPNHQLIDHNTGKIKSGAQLLYDDKWEEAAARTGKRQDYHFSASSAGKRGKGYIGLGYTNDGGYIKNTKNERISLLANGSIKFRTWIEAGVQAQGSYTNERLTPQSKQRYDQSFPSDQFFKNIQLVPAVYPVYVHDNQGNFVLDSNGHKIYDLNRMRPSLNGIHPVAELLEATNQSRKLEWMAMPYIRIEIAKQLYIQTTYQATAFQRNFRNRMYLQPNRTNFDANSMYKLFRPSIAWRRSMGNHHIAVEAAYETGSLKQDYMTFSYLNGLQFAAETGLQANSTYGTRAGLRYSYKQRYELSLGGSTEAFETYAPSLRNQKYWHIGLNWNLHRESFLKNVTFLDEWRLRLSHGKQGNNPFSVFAGYAEASVFPEYVLHSNIGTSMSLFQNRIHLQADVYQRQTLYGTDNGRFQHLSGAHIRNRGIEASLGLDWIRKEKLRFQSSFIVNHNQNRITGGYNPLLTTGDGLYTFYAPNWAGLNDKGQPLYIISDGRGGSTLSTEFDRANLPENRIKLGSALPMLSGSVEHSFTYRNFTLSALFTGGWKGYIQDNAYMNMMYIMGEYNWHTDILRAWTPTNRNTEIPALTVRDYYNPNMYRDATYINIRNVYLGYRLPGTVLERTGLKDLSLYLTAENLWTWTSAPGIDPQAQFDGRGQFGYTLARTIMFGIQLGF
jgi:TonB-linked SusC/RagA family outer membrane protein